MKIGHHHIAGALIGIGVAIQIAEGISQADAALNNVTFDQTSVGAIVGPVEKYLPFSLGWTLIAIGASIFVIHAVMKG